MRTFRLLLTLTSMTCIAVGGLVACGDDDSGSTTSSSSGGSLLDGSTSDATKLDGSVPPNDSGLDSTAPAHAQASAVTVYAGQLATVSSTGSTGTGTLTYAWTITSVPAGSKITTASLTGPTTASPTFTPDLPGTYAIGLTLTAGNGTATATTNLTVVDAPVFYFRSENDASIASAELSVVGATTADGGHGPAVSCFSKDGGSNFDGDVEFGAGLWADTWEAPAGIASRAVFSFPLQEDGGLTQVFYGTTSAATCATPPTKLDSVPPAEQTTSPFEVPRFSPDGTRLLYIRSSKSTGTKIATVGFDGTTPHSIAFRGALADGGQDDAGGRASLFTPGARPSWVNQSTVAWLNQIDPTHWQVVSAPDQDNAATTLLMTCSGKLPTDFAVLPSGEVLVSQEIDDVDANANVSNLLAYTVNPTTKACTTSRNISKATSNSGGSVARSFLLSPDKTKVAFYQLNDATGTMQVKVAPVDGSSDAVDLGVASSASQGPRWVAGGAFLSWGVSGYLVDGGRVGDITNMNYAIVTAQVGSDAGPRPVVVATDDVRTIAINQSTCSFGAGVGSGVSGLGFLGLLGLRLVRRRNKKA